MKTTNSSIQQMYFVQEKKVNLFIRPNCQCLEHVWSTLIDWLIFGVLEGVGQPEVVGWTRSGVMPLAWPTL